MTVRKRLPNLMLLQEMGVARVKGAACISAKFRNFF
jgi:hypothetical protein